MQLAAAGNLATLELSLARGIAMRDVMSVNGKLTACLASSVIGAVLIYAKQPCCEK